MSRSWCGCGGSTCAQKCWSNACCSWKRKIWIRKGSNWAHQWIFPISNRPSESFSLPLLSVLPVASPLTQQLRNIASTRERHFTITTYQQQTKADNMHLPPPNLPDPTRVETKSEVRQTNPTKNVHAQSYARRHIPPASTPPPAFGTVFGLMRHCQFRTVPIRW